MRGVARDSRATLPTVTWRHVRSYVARRSRALWRPTAPARASAGCTRRPCAPSTSCPDAASTASASQTAIEEQMAMLCLIPNLEDSKVYDTQMWCVFIIIALGIRPVWCRPNICQMHYWYVLNLMLFQ